MYLVTVWCLKLGYYIEKVLQFQLPSSDVQMQTDVLEYRSNTTNIYHCQNIFLLQCGCILVEKQVCL